MFEIGQNIMCGNHKCLIIDISPTPFIEFEDGSKHYALDIIRDDGILMYVNDAQIQTTKE